MSHNAQAKKVTVPTTTVNVDGVAVPVPVSQAEAELAHFREQRIEIQAKIDGADPDDELTLRRDERALVFNEYNIERYANPLHAFAPHIYPPVDHYL